MLKSAAENHAWPLFFKEPWWVTNCAVWLIPIFFFTTHFVHVQVLAWGYGNLSCLSFLQRGILFSARSRWHFFPHDARSGIDVLQSGLLIGWRIWKHCLWDVRPVDTLVALTEVLQPHLSINPNLFLMTKFWHSESINIFFGTTFSCWKLVSTI